MVNISDEDLSRLISSAMEKIVGQLEKEKSKKLSAFESTEKLLVFLADASPKEREKFLSHWKTENAKNGIGRKKQSIALRIAKALDDGWRKELTETGKKISFRLYADKILLDYYERNPPKDDNGLPLIGGAKADFLNAKVKQVCNEHAKINSKRAMLHKKLS